MLSLTAVTSLLSPIVMKAQSGWLLANERRIEATSRTISSIKGIKMMGLGEESFKSIHELRKLEVRASKYGLFLLVLLSIKFISGLLTSLDRIERCTLPHSQSVS